MSPTTEHRTTLAQAQERVGLIMNLAPGLWLWDRDDILWISTQWGIFAHELELCREFADDLDELAWQMMPWPVAVLTSIREGMEWWSTEAPLGLRILTALLFTFVYAYTLGRL